jgi:glycosyltransferase involved in cell wall biosynthesis
MACDVITIGARCGAIPEVIGNAGLTFEEGNALELQQHLQRLIDDVSLREKLRHQGRQRVTENYTQAAIAQKTVRVYRQVLGEIVPELVSISAGRPTAAESTFSN